MYKRQTLDGVTRGGPPPPLVTVLCRGCNNNKCGSNVHLSLPFFLGPANDLLVSVAHHGDEHVEQKDRYEHSERDERRFRQRRKPRQVKLFILQTRFSARHSIIMLATIMKLGV